jgi:hypothetical protein
MISSWWGMNGPNWNKSDFMSKTTTHYASHFSCLSQFSKLDYRKARIISATDDKHKRSESSNWTLLVNVKLAMFIYSECLKNSATTCTKLLTIYFIKTNIVM